MQATDFGEVADERVGDSVGEVFLLWIAREVLQSKTIIEETAGGFLRVYNPYVSAATAIIGTRMTIP